jgi:hypothetical protein
VWPKILEKTRSASGAAAAIADRSFSVRRIDPLGGTRVAVDADSVRSGHSHQGIRTPSAVGCRGVMDPVWPSVTLVEIDALAVTG